MQCSDKAGINQCSYRVLVFSVACGRCSQGMKSELSLAGGSGPVSSKLNRIVVRCTVLKSYRNSKSHGLQVAV